MATSQAHQVGRQSTGRNRIALEVESSKLEVLRLGFPPDPAIVGLVPIATGHANGFTEVLPELVQDHDSGDDIMPKRFRRNCVAGVIGIDKQFVCLEMGKF